MPLLYSIGGSEARCAGLGTYYVAPRTSSSLGPSSPAGIPAFRKYHFASLLTMSKTNRDARGMKPSSTYSDTQRGREWPMEAARSPMHQASVAVTVSAKSPP